MPDSTLRVLIVGDSTGAKRAFTETAAEAEASAVKIGASMDAATARLGGSFSRLGQLGSSWGVPMVGALGTVGSKLDEATGKSHNLRQVLESLGGASLAGLGAGAVAAGVEGVRLADTYETSHARMQAAIKATGQTETQYQSQISATEARLEKLGFTNADVEGSIASAEISTQSMTKSLSEMGLAADLARDKHISLQQATEVLDKAMTGNLRPLKQLGIDLPVTASNALKLQQAQDALTKAEQARQAVLQQYPTAAEAGAKGHAQFEAAVNRVTAAEQKLSQEQAAPGQIFQALTQRLGGQAQTYADTFSGKLATLRAEGEDLGKSFGLVLIPKLEEVAGWMGHNKEAVEVLAGVVGGVLAVAVGTFTYGKLADLAKGVKGLITDVTTLGQKLLGLGGSTPNLPKLDQAAQGSGPITVDGAPAASALQSAMQQGGADAAASIRDALTTGGTAAGGEMASGVESGATTGGTTLGTGVETGATAGATTLGGGVETGATTGAATLGTGVEGGATVGAGELGAGEVAGGARAGTELAAGEVAGGTRAAAELGAGEVAGGTTAAGEISAGEVAGGATAGGEMAAGGRWAAAGTALGAGASSVIAKVGSPLGLLIFAGLSDAISHLLPGGKTSNKDILAGGGSTEERFKYALDPTHWMGVFRSEWSDVQSTINNNDVATANTGIRQGTPGTVSGYTDAGDTWTRLGTSATQLGQAAQYLQQLQSRVGGEKGEAAKIDQGQINEIVIGLANLKGGNDARQAAVNSLQTTAWNNTIQAAQEIKAAEAAAQQGNLGAAARLSAAAAQHQQAADKAAAGAEALQRIGPLQSVAANSQKAAGDNLTHAAGAQSSAAQKHEEAVAQAFKAALDQQAGAADLKSAAGAHGAAAQRLLLSAQSHFDAAGREIDAANKLEPGAKFMLDAGGLHVTAAKAHSDAAKAHHDAAGDHHDAANQHKTAAQNHKDAAGAHTRAASDLTFAASRNQDSAHHLDDSANNLKDTSGHFNGIADSLHNAGDNLGNGGAAGSLHESGDHLHWAGDGLATGAQMLGEAANHLQSIQAPAAPTAAQLAAPFGGNYAALAFSTLPHYATGAVVDSPQVALVGESGREAVIPGDDPQRALSLIGALYPEMVSSVLSGGGLSIPSGISTSPGGGDSGGPVTIVVQVGSQRVAQTLLPALRSASLRRGRALAGGEVVQVQA